MAIYSLKSRFFSETRKKSKLSVKRGLRSSEGNYTNQARPLLKRNLNALRGYASGLQLQAGKRNEQTREQQDRQRKAGKDANQQRRQDKTGRRTAQRNLLTYQTGKRQGDKAA